MKSMRSCVVSSIALACVLLSAAGPLFAGCSSDSATEPQADASTEAAVDAGSADSGSDAGISDAEPDADPPFDCTQEAANDLPTDLRCTGLYGRWSKKTIAAGVREFAPGVTLWSDGAVKTRWVYLPPGSKIDSADMDEWVFPVGTKFWKEFVLAGKRVETRHFWKIAPGAWIKTSYRWSADESVAIRTDDGFNAPDGGDPDASSYEIPSLAKCDQCHAGRTDKILGFEAVGLGLPGATGLTLAALATEGKLTVVPPATTLAIPEDTASIGKAAPAFGWLHANCGTACHNRNPSATCNFRGMFLRLGYNELHPADGGVASMKSLDAYVTTYDVDAIGLPGDKRIAHGNPALSAISYFAGRRSPTVPNQQMPPIDSHLVDTVHVGQVNDFITTLP
jgi:hypothetical protein